MKKFILALVFILLSSTMFENSRTVANANDTLFETPVCLTVNGNYIKSDTPGYLEGGYTMAVSYTHLDVYKRQVSCFALIFFYMDGG